ncbi:hypothetical protein CAPTEDRAFT_79687, partial [Capitella teleta]
VPDEKMTASSQYDEYHGPKRGRIDTVAEGTNQGEYRGAWCPWGSSPGQWIQVEFNSLMTVQAIRTRGRYEYASWVESYVVNFSEDGIHWEPYQEPYGT